MRTKSKYLLSILVVLMIITLTFIISSAKTAVSYGNYYIDPPTADGANICIGIHSDVTATDEIVIAAFYDDSNVLTGIEIKKLYEADEDGKLNFENRQFSKLRAFIWNGINTMIPCAKAAAEYSADEITEKEPIYQYGYVVDMYTKADETYLKLFAPSDTSETTLTPDTDYKVSDFRLKPGDIKLNGINASHETFIQDLTEHAAVANPDADIDKINGVNLTGYNQLIKFAINKSGDLSDIALFDPDYDGSINENSSMLIRYKEMDPNARYYVTETAVKSLESGPIFYSIKSSTPMFVIPKDRTNINAYTVKAALSADSMSIGGTYYLDAYDLNEQRFPAVLLVYNRNFKNGTSIHKESAYQLLAEDISQDHDNEKGNKLITYNSDTETVVTMIAEEARALFDGLSMGDIILTGTNGNKQADSIMRVISYDDINRILAGTPTEVYDSYNDIPSYERYNWREEQMQTNDNNWQRFVFDFRFPKPSQTEPSDDYYVLGKNDTRIASRAFMCNIMQTVPEESLLYVTRDGFDDNGNLNTSDYMNIKISPSTKLIRYDGESNRFTPYESGTDNTLLTIHDLKDEKNNGIFCSKVRITYTDDIMYCTPTADFIVIYE